MAKVIGPWTPNYPVDFKSNGDTTRAAFGKHIQEIERIYGLLSGLGASKIEAEDLTAAMGDYVKKTEFNNHVNSTNPHLNLQLATLGGSLGFDRISGNLGLDRTTGNLNGSRLTGDIAATLIKGTLTGANIDAGNVNGLSDLIDSASSGISQSSLGADGYIKFGNGLKIGWGHGRVSTSAYDNNQYDLSSKFSEVYACACTPSMCYASETLSGNTYDGTYSAIGVLQLINAKKIVLQQYGDGSAVSLDLSFYYIAVGK